MRYFLTGFLFVQLALITADGLLRVSNKLPATDQLPRLLMLLCVFPTLAAGLTAAAVHRHRPRRIFDFARRNPRAPFARGLLAGLLAIVVAALPIAVVESTSFDAAILAASGAVSSLLVITLLARRRIPGRCIACDYDLRGSHDTGRCPECGTSPDGTSPAPARV